MCTWLPEGPDVRRTSFRRPLGALAALLVLGACSANDGTSSRPESELGLGVLSSALSREDAGPAALTLTSIAEPRPVTTSDGEQHLLYEVLLANVASTAQTLTSLEMRGARRRAPLVSASGDALASLLVGVDAATRTLEPGGFALAFLDVTFERGEPLPKRLRTVVSSDGELGAAQAAVDVDVVRERPIRLAPPLRGERLIAVNGCCDGAHRRAVLLSEQGSFGAQRYAIDFVRIDGLTSFAGDPSDNGSYFIFGDDVLAVSDGLIVEARDGMRENDPTQPLPPFDPNTAAGNFVLQDLGEGHFALYAHFQNGSVRVRPGERVRRGQVLGRVGNTGNSTEPHLHFHVSNGPSPLFSDGLPYVFERFELEAHVDLSGPEPAIVPTPEPRTRRKRLPLALEILTFR